jgi:hypothetical protein
MSAPKKIGLTNTAKNILRSLPEKEVDFVLCYACNPGPSGAIKAAAEISPEGLTKSELRQVAAEMLSNPEVKKAIDKLAKCFTTNPGEVLSAISDQAFPDLEAVQACYIDHGNGLRTWDWKKAFENGAAAFVRKVTPTKNGDAVEFHDRIRALETLGKYHGLWDDKPNVQVNNFDLSKLSEDQLRAMAAGKPVSDSSAATEQQTIDVSYRTLWEPEINHDPSESSSDSE